MGVNYYSIKLQERLKDMLKENGYPSLSHIPVEAFLHCVMAIFGMGEKSADRWLKNFEMVGLIKVSRVDECNWVVNFVKTKKKKEE